MTLRIPIPRDLSTLYNTCEVNKVKLKELDSCMHAGCTPLLGFVEYFLDALWWGGNSRMYFPDGVQGVIL